MPHTSAQLPVAPDPAERRADLRRRQAELSREHILDAAEELFAEKGYTNATMRQIAEAAGFSAAAVYGFVAGKEELVAAIMDRHGARLLDLHAEVLAGVQGPRHQLDEIIDVQVGYHLGHPNFARLFQHTTGMSFLAIEAAMDDTARRRLHEALELLEGVFVRGIECGDFVAGDVSTYAILFSAIMQGYLFRILFQHAETPGDRAELHAIVGRAFGRRDAG